MVKIADILVIMKAFWALVPNKGSTAILERENKPEGSRLDCDDWLEAAL